MDHANFTKVIQQAREAFASGKTRNVDFRKKQLKALLRMYKENETQFITALSEDLKKPQQEIIVLEMNVLKDDIEYILSRLDKWVKPEKVPVTLVTLFDKSRIYHDPYGVVLVMGAWNYPLQLPFLPLSGAIAAGNCVVIKPSEISSATAKLIADLVPKYLDNECYHVICGGIAETTELLKERFDYIFYTGSAHVGKIVREAANKYLTPTTLELGGKSPVFIDDSVDMDVAVRRIMWGKCINIGQTCVAPDYILSTKIVQEKFIAKAKEILKEWYGDNPQRSPDLGRIINNSHFNRLIGYLKEGKLVHGGYYDATDRWIEPTILTDVSPDSKVMNEEIFGPILPMLTVESPSEAINFINSKTEPLAMYLFTTDSKLQKRIIKGLKCGSICINDVVVHIGKKPLAFYVFSNKHDLIDIFMEEVWFGGSSVNDVIFHVAVPGLPFGGVGNSGMGSYHGKASFDTFTHRKSCLIRNYNRIADAIGAFRYPPYSDNKVNFLSFMLKERSFPPLSYLTYPLAFALGALSLFAVQQIVKKELRQSVAKSVRSYLDVLSGHK